MSDAARYRAILEQKKELVFELLRLSSDLDLAADAPDEAAERYVEFVSARGAVISKLQALDSELDGMDAVTGETEATTALADEIQVMAGRVVKLEPEIRRKALGLSAHYQRRLKLINTRRQEAQSRGEYTKGLRYQSKA